MATQQLHPLQNVPRRILMLSVPKKNFAADDDDMPKYTKAGTRISALTGQLQNTDIAWPYIRRLIALKRMYKKVLSPERLQKLDQLIEAANTTMYTKLASCAVDLRKNQKDWKKSKSWSTSDWKKHMEYISPIAGPKKVFEPPKPPRGNRVPLDVLLPRLNVISTRPDFKCYRTQSKEEWYRDPEKVSPRALKYVITERIKKLAEPRVVREDY